MTKIIDKESNAGHDLTIKEEKLIKKAITKVVNRKITKV